ncbi:Odorant receptor 373 [Nylanderia fulva]|uniref:Odorant receptor 373 n=1 Tax=Nylanderia fulva TaxID=613905 RepID=A0A6G1LPG7_9HYME|nr:Odorant receptor 373 [Nylanderia fulva]
MVKEDWTRSKTEEEQRIMIRRAQTARLIMKWGYFVIFISYILVVIFPSFGIFLRYLTNITDPGRLMPLQTYYMYNTNESPLYEITFFLQGLSLMATATTYTNTDTFMGGLVFHVCGQLENLKARILNVEFHRFEDSLSANVQDHARLMRSIKIIDDTFTLMLLGRNLSIARLIYILISFINTFTHMFLHCAWNGVYEAVCQYKWYNLKSSQARNLLIIMRQTKKPLYLTAGKLFPMTMATFCSLLKTSGGYISVLLAHRN